MIDLSVGKIFEKLTDAKLNDTRNASRTAHTVKVVDADVLIMGSSRANYHYVSSILADSLNCSVFNCGLDGQGFSYSAAMIQSVLKRYSPKVIIIDIIPTLLQTKSTFGELNELYPYYDHDTFIKEIIIEDDTNNRYKMLSKMFRYNSKLGPIARNLVLGGYSNDNGYVALSDYVSEHPELVHVKYKESGINKSQLELLMSCIQSCKEKNVTLILSISPRFEKSNVNEISSYKYLKRLLVTHNIPLIDMDGNSVINDSTMFRDFEHLNHKGAVAFTKAFSERLKEELNLTSESSE